MSAEIKITLIKSHIGKPPKQRAVLLGMGLNKVNKTVVLQNTPEIKGMINKVSHMLRVEE
jgi:large subunit ribosomal protein L30